MMWANAHAGLSEVRDQREVRTLCQAIDYINQDCIEMGLDVLVARIHAIQAAKQKGGSWDKAEKIELIPASASSIAPAGLAGLPG